jgi:hypothetical protein
MKKHIALLAVPIFMIINKALGEDSEKINEIKKERWPETPTDGGDKIGKIALTYTKTGASPVTIIGRQYNHTIGVSIYLGEIHSLSGFDPPKEQCIFSVWIGNNPLVPEGKLPSTINIKQDYSFLQDCDDAQFKQLTELIDMCGQIQTKIANRLLFERTEGTTYDWGKTEYAREEIPNFIEVLEEELANTD